MSNYTIKDFKNQLLDGILFKNPVFMQLLGMCATLAVTTSVSNAIGMGLSTTAVLVCSNIFISLLRNFIPKQIRIASYIVIISGFVTAVQLLIKAYLPELDKSLGLFIPLIVVNCIILARAESFASKNAVLPSAVDGLSMGLGFTFALILLASVREIIGAGTFAGIRILPVAYEPAIIFVLPSGAFLTLGCLIAVMNKLMYIRNKKLTAKNNAAAKAAAEAELAEKAKELAETQAVENIPSETEVKEEDKHELFS